MKRVAGCDNRKLLVRAERPQPLPATTPPPPDPCQDTRPCEISCMQSRQLAVVPRFSFRTPRCRQAGQFHISTFKLCGENCESVGSGGSPVFCGVPGDGTPILFGAFVGRPSPWSLIIPVPSLSVNCATPSRHIQHWQWLQMGRNLCRKPEILKLHCVWPTCSWR